jgi:hypothetical protein
MSYPALSDFASDPGRTYARWCVYMALQPPFLSFTVPRDVKIAALQAKARIATGTVSEALAWLERRGYIVVHSRDRRGMPSVTLAWALPASTTSHDYPERTA